MEKYITTTATGADASDRPLAIMNLLVQMDELRTENRALRRKVLALEAQRDRWKQEVSGLRWSVRQWRRRKSA